MPYVWNLIKLSELFKQYFYLTNKCLLFRLNLVIYYLRQDDVNEAYVLIKDLVTKARSINIDKFCYKLNKMD